MKGFDARDDRSGNLSFRRSMIFAEPGIRKSPVLSSVTVARKQGAGGNELRFGKDRIFIDRLRIRVFQRSGST